MEILKKLLEDLPCYPIVDVRIGLHWTVAVVDTSQQLQSGLAATLGDRHDHQSSPDIPAAGELTQYNSLELAGWVLGDQMVQASVGLAVLNASLPRYPDAWREANGEEVIARYGHGRRVVLVGHFPFVPSLRTSVGELWVLEQHPLPGDFPAEAAPEVIPQAEVVAITGMALINHTLPDLLAHVNPEAFVILLGPSTPLSPLLFEFGIDWLAGAILTKTEPVLQAVSQGADFRQLHRFGVRLVNMARPGLEI